MHGGRGGACQRLGAAVGPGGVLTSSSSASSLSAASPSISSVYDDTGVILYVTLSLRNKLCCGVATPVLCVCVASHRGRAWAWGGRARVSVARSAAGPRPSQRYARLGCDTRTRRRSLLRER